MATTLAASTVTVAPLVKVSMEEYLRTSFSPDSEYIDGYLKEKPVVMSVHGTLESLLSFWFYQHEEEWQIRVGVEVPTQVTPDRIRLPDVVVDHARFWPQTLVDPPLLVIEVLAPSDAEAETKNRIRDYLTMGIQTIWVIDPETRTAEIWGETQKLAATRLTVAGSQVYVELETIFARLDKYQTTGAVNAPGSKPSV